MQNIIKNEAKLQELLARLMPGIIVNFKNYTSAALNFFTKEFKTGHSHRQDGISVGFALGRDAYAA
ncbi:MAG: hypothetical protein WDM90_10680 [Ferruginibacter sp.]